MEQKEQEEENQNQIHQKLNKFILPTLQTVFYIPDFISKSEQTSLLHNIYEVSASRWKSLKNRRLQNWGGVVHEKGLLPQPLPPWLTKITSRISEQLCLFPAPINHVLINEYLPDQGIMPHQDGPAYFPVVAILSLESPVVLEFTPHPRMKECMTSERHEKSNFSGVTDFEMECSSPMLACNDFQSSSVLLMPCSLLVFKDQAYTDYLHGIQNSRLPSLDEVINISEISKLNESEIICDPQEGTMSVNSKQNKFLQRTSTRVSLTCRLVLKVHKNLFKF